jgi:hypothetical protein
MSGQPSASSCRVDSLGDGSNPVGWSIADKSSLPTPAFAHPNDKVSDKTR